MLQQLKESIIVPIHNKSDRKTVVIIKEYHCYQLQNISSLSISRKPMTQVGEKHCTTF